MNDMATASPTPAGGGSHFTSLGRRTSARQSALRRPTSTSSRPQLSRSESNPAPQSQPQQIAALHDSSDDEEPVVPMKLSALTKALLNDGASEGSSGGAQSVAGRPASPPARPASRVTRRSTASASFSAAAEDREPAAAEARQTRRQGRTSSVQRAATGRSSPPRGGETSPAPQPRKRVVRLSNSGPGNGAFNSSFNGSFESSVRRSLSGTSRSKRQESVDIVDKKPSQAPAPVEPEQQQPEQQLADINTPVVPVRTVRIAVGSSGSKGRSGSSSGHSKSSRGYSDHDQELPEDPATVGRPVAIAPQSSMRIQRIGKMGGSFLSGPARRGRRRQSEEDGQDHGEGDAFGSGQEPESQQPQYMDLGMGEQPQSSFLASNYREFAAASGSPVSSRDPSRAAVRRGTSASVSPPEPREAERSHLELDFKIPTPPPRVPSSLGKENQAPAAYKPKPVVISLLDDTKEPVKPIQPLVSDVRANAPPPQPRATSPDRKVLAQKSENTPRRAAPPPPPKMSVLETATANAGASAATQASKKRQIMLRVNGRTYTRIDCIGRGGSGKVYRVSAENGKMLALKRVSLESADENTVRGFKGEIDLLKRLHGVDRVIQLIDHELNLEKQLLSVLMEVGELDFNTLLKSRQSSPEGARLDPVFIRYYWKEMLECVQAVHAKDVVHSDLKPANFVLVQGRLKLIDFGIANAIQTEMTVNVHRETQIGTPNYMSPESLMDSNQYAFTSAHNGKFCIPPPLQHHQKGAPKIMKLGKPSDVWSLGCILYQMVYGLPPFGKIANQMSRCQAIINWAYQVEFPEVTEDGSRVPPSLIRTMRRCLNREQKERPTCDELLADTDPFLYPQEFDPGVYAMAEQGKVLPITEELLGRIIQSVVQRCGERMPSGEEMKSGMLTQGYWNGVRRVVTGAGNNGGGGNSSRS
ncbi:kinase-like domain-containing protein [Apiosordaria backusii]|uniref:Kinase-like domain-containing protein n=1 Tax=Apiosordaria backusii TaxID=314023 RepID=A0AA40AN73_9PEZI|nr:kinase-like domain-containing protein [Apiosordaria backusii]